MLGKCRAAFRLFWRFKSRPARPAHHLDSDTIALIQRLARENQLWGAERIRGELLKLGIRVAKRTIQKYMRAVRSQSPAGPTGSAFLKTQGQDIWACDFVPVVTLFFQTLYALVIVHVGSRRLVHVNATAHPTDDWIAQQLRNATPFGETAKHLICDNAAKFGPAFDAAAKTCGLEIIHTPCEAPRANAICERFVGSAQRECLDHVLVLSNRQLVRVLVEYTGYFNLARPHQGLAQQTPDSRQSGQPSVATAKSIARPTSPTAPVQLSKLKLMVVPALNGLHHSYAWVTWRGCPHPVCWARLPPDEANSQHTGVVGSYADLLERWHPRRPFEPPTAATPAFEGRGWRSWTELYGTPEQNPAFWDSISATSFVRDLSGPLQLHHDLADSGGVLAEPVSTRAGGGQDGGALHVSRRRSQPGAQLWAGHAAHD